MSGRTSERSDAPAHASPAHLGWLAASGVALLGAGVLLYATALSRVVGAVVFGVGAAAVIAAAMIRRRDTWPGRTWLVVAIVVLGALVALGLWTWIYATFLTQDTPA